MRSVRLGSWGACAFVALVLGACAAPEVVGIRALVAEGQENELALAEKYEGKELKITGRVVTFGLAKREFMAHEFTVFAVEGSFIHPGTGTSRLKTEDLPYALLAPDDGEGGGVGALCYFPSDARADVATLRRSAPATLVCAYSSFRKFKGVPMVVLTGCSVAE